MKKHALTRGIRFVVLDVETAPADDGDRVIQFGHTVLIPDLSPRPPAAQEFFIDPGVAIENTHQHGIDDTQVAGAKTFDRAVEDILDILLGHHGQRYETVLVAHYAQFDIGVLRLEFARRDQDLPDLAVLDTHALAQHLDVSSEGYSRATLLKVLSDGQRKPRKDHSAASDADDAAFILDRLLQRAVRARWTNLDALLQVVAEAKAGPNGQPRLRTGDYPEAAAERRTSLGGFRPIYRSPEHLRSHEETDAAPASTREAADAWLVGVRECVALRCPQLGARARAFPYAFPDLFEVLRDDLRTAIDAGQQVEANTLLFVVSRAFLRYFYRDFRGGRTARPVEVLAEFDRMAELIAPLGRCDFTAGPPVDACPGCRRRPTARGCAHDTWAVYWGRAFQLKRYKPGSVTRMWQSSGWAGEQIAVRPLLASALMEEQFRLEQEVLDRPAARKGAAGPVPPWPLPDEPTLRAEQMAAWAALAKAERKRQVARYTRSRLCDLAETAGVTSPTATLLRAGELAQSGRTADARGAIASTLDALDGARTPAASALLQLDVSLAGRVSRVRPVAPDPPENASPTQRRIGHRAPARSSQRRFTLPGTPETVHDR